jgi:hypothetical protein
MEEKFAIALSEKEEDAPKEVSLKIKSVFPKLVKYLLVFFTPHYQPLNILNTINFTLQPQILAGMQSPFLLFEDRLIEKGIVACCINKPEFKLKELFIKNDEPQNVESSLRATLKKYSRENLFLFSLLSHRFNILNYIRGVDLALGKTVNIFGGGYIKKYFSKNYQIINDTVEDGLINIITQRLEFNFSKISGFVPLGKPFTITKTMAKRGIIMEIDGQPAINIYKHFLDEKFDTFVKNYLFTLYPLGIKNGDNTHLVSIIECLQDGSLACMGEVKENSQAHLMLLNPSFLMESLRDMLKTVKEEDNELIFLINSLPRKKILKDHAAEEVTFIKQALGEKTKIFGTYCDYSFFSNSETREIELGTNNILIAGLK